MAETHVRVQMTALSLGPRESCGSRASCSGVSGGGPAGGSPPGGGPAGGGPPGGGAIDELESAGMMMATTIVDQNEPKPWFSPGP